MAIKLYYIHDPMCSWCYAFQTVITQLQQQLDPLITLEKIVGGLAPDSQETMPKAMQSYIQNTWHKIEQTVPGTHFNFDFWQANTPIRSTYPACRAVLAAKMQGLDFEDKMIDAIQIAYYQRAKNPSLTKTLIDCAKQCNLAIDRFTVDLSNSVTDQTLKDHIQLAQTLNATSFPSLRLVDKNGKIHIINIDYLNPHNILSEITQIQKAISGNIA